MLPDQVPEGSMATTLASSPTPMPTSWYDGPQIQIQKCVDAEYHRNLHFPTYIMVLIVTCVWMLALCLLWFRYVESRHIRASSSTTHRPPPAIHRPPSTTHHPPPKVHHPPPTVNHPLPSGTYGTYGMPNRGRRRSCHRS